MKARAWRWIKENSVLAIHDEQIAEHGGLPGVRDLALLQSALAPPQNLEADGQPDVGDLAAAYAVGISRTHPFLDGNRRTAWVVAETFLLKNGYELPASDPESLPVMLAVAGGSVAEKDFALWLRGQIRRRKTG